MIRDETDFERRQRRVTMTWSLGMLCLLVVLATVLGMLWLR